MNGDLSLQAGRGAGAVLEAGVELVGPVGPGTKLRRDVTDVVETLVGEGWAALCDLYVSLTLLEFEVACTVFPQLASCFGLHDVQHCIMDRLEKS